MRSQEVNCIFCALCFFQVILTHHFPFKLNAKVMQVLISIFLYHDFSVRNFIKGVQVQSGFEMLNPSCVSYCRWCLQMQPRPVVNKLCSVSLQLALLEHFHSQPLSVLCCKKKDALLNVMQLSHSDLERIRNLPSFKRYRNTQLKLISW